jgi:hypothetical protein
MARSESAATDWSRRRRPGGPCWRNLSRMTATAQPATYRIDVYHDEMRGSWRWKCHHDRCGEDAGGYRSDGAATGGGQAHAQAHVPDEAFIGPAPGDTPPPA